ncbi:MAG: hypothetical protein SVV03_00710 [Candidatus Nanohaloarchaea archaeon]|nr:hypothetical protein [Candidatus Nanohaloarchaea archaeon]
MALENMEAELEDAEAEIDVEELRQYFSSELSRMMGTMVRRKPDNRLVATVNEPADNYSFF